MRNKNFLHELQDPTNYNILTKRRFSGTSCFRGHGRRNGERRRKSVRGCIVSPDLSVLNLVIVKQGLFHGSVFCHTNSRIPSFLSFVMFVSFIFGFAPQSSRLSKFEWILGCTGAFLQLSFGNLSLPLVEVFFLIFPG